MHEQGYQYLGETRFGRLTQPELMYLQLGHLIEIDNQEDAQDAAKRSSGGHSKSRADTRRLLKKRASGRTPTASPS